MIKLLFGSLITASLLFTGCANSGLNGIGTENVKKVFESGTIESSQKVLVGKDNMSMLTNAGIGAGVGAVAGAVAGDSTKATLIGAGVGAIAGAVFTSFQEVEAYEIQVKSNNGSMRTAYIEKEFPLNTIIEYVVQEDGKITNIDVKKIGTPKEIIKEKIVEKEVIKTKIVEKPALKKAETKSTPKVDKVEKQTPVNVSTPTENKSAEIVPKW